MSLQLIISPVDNADNFMIDIAASSPVEELRSRVASKLSVAPTRVKLVSEGIELQDGAALADFYLVNLSTVRLVVTPDTASGKSVTSAAPGVSSVPLGGSSSASEPTLSTEATATDAPGAGFLTDSEMPRSIIVTNIPSADPVATEKCLFNTFSNYGEMARVIFQDDRQSGGGVQQRAVVIFHRDSSAAAALAADGSELMGSPVAVMLASGVQRMLHPEMSPGDAAHASGEAGSGTGVGGGRTHTRYFGPSAPIAHLLAQGYLYGHQGVAHVRGFGEAHGLSQRIKVVVDKITNTAGRVNEKYQVQATVQATYEAAAAQAADLDRELHIVEKVNSMSSFALARAAEWCTIAMRNPAVASTVTAAREFVSQAASAVQGTLEEAKKEMDTRTRSGQAATAATAPGAPAASGTSQAGTGLPPAHPSSESAEVIPE